VNKGAGVRTRGGLVLVIVVALVVVWLIVVFVVVALVVVWLIVVFVIVEGWFLVIVLAVVLLLLLLLRGSSQLEDHTRWKGPRQTLFFSPTVLQAGGPIKDHWSDSLGVCACVCPWARLLSSELCKYLLTLYTCIY